MLGLILRFGAPSPVRGMNRLAIQQAVTVTSISQAKWMGSPPSPAARPATMVPIKMAMNVPPSTSALPLVEFFTLQMIGQDAVFDRTEQRRDHAVEEDRQEQHRDRVKPEADHGQDGDGDLEQLQSAGHNGLVEAVGDLAAKTGEEKEREGERRGRELDQRAGFGLAEPEQQNEDQRLLEKVIAERGERLAPEQRRKTSRRHQGRSHSSPTVESRFRGGILDGRHRLGDAGLEENSERLAPRLP